MNIINNDKGSAIIAALLMTLALSLVVFIAMDNSLSNSRMMRSNRQYTDNIYKAETGITVAVEDHKTTWLRSASTLFSDTTGDAKEENLTVKIKDENNNDMTLARYEVGRIQISPATPTGSFSENFNSMNHQAPPRIGSATSPKIFEIRRYGIRSTALPDNNLTVESGLDKTFNKN